MFSLKTGKTASNNGQQNISYRFQLLLTWLLLNSANRRFAWYAGLEFTPNDCVPFVFTINLIHVFKS